MTISTELLERCESKCELCGNSENVSGYTVPPKSNDNVENQIAICTTCLNQIDRSEEMNENHWRCLNDSIWSTIPAVQVMSYRMLNRLGASSWAQDLLGMMYLEDQTMEWAQQGAVDNTVIHKDSNGVVLHSGDTVVIIKDLNVKGTSFVAKRGTSVRRIRLVHDNAEHIEGKVDGQQIVILTKFVKKS